MKENYTPGQGCECHAHSEAECGCDADWTPREVYELREQRDRLRYEREFFQSALIEQGDVLSKVIEKRDRLADALEHLATCGGKHQPVLQDTVANIASKALAAVKGGDDE